MIEVKIYLAARYELTTDNDIGGYGYVIKSENYSSTGVGSYFKTSKDRISMIGCIAALKDAYKNVGPVISIKIHAKHSETVNNMIYGHCKKFKNLPHQDLVQHCIGIIRHSWVHTYNMTYNSCEEMKLANKLSKEALKNPDPRRDLLDFKRSLATPLF